MQGTCKLDKNYCWFRHENRIKVNQSLSNDSSMENEIKDKHDANTNENLNDSVFCMAQEKMPPDQMCLIMNMLKKLSVQVENLEKFTQNIK